VDILYRATFAVVAIPAPLIVKIRFRTETADVIVPQGPETERATPKNISYVLRHTFSQENWSEYLQPIRAITCVIHAADIRQPDLFGFEDPTDARRAGIVV
jgi:hypothetical protein